MSKELANEHRRRWRVVLDVCTTLALLVAAGLVIRSQLFTKSAENATTGRARIAVPDAPLSMDGFGSRGSTNAPVGIIVFSDFQCPYCGKFAREVMPTLEREYISVGKVRLSFRHLPLGMHAVATPAAKAAECAGEQGAFWAMHDGLFDGNGKQLTESRIAEVAASLPIVQPAFQACYSRSTPDRVIEDQRLAKQLGVSSTPSFLIGKILASGELKVSSVVPGIGTIERFKGVIDPLFRTVSTDSYLKTPFAFILR